MKIIKIIIAIIIILTTLAIFGREKIQHKNESQTNSNLQSSQEDKPKIISTKPDPLDNTIISASEIIEITFNRPLENAPELKTRMDPKIDYKVELSQDRKTAEIIPAKVYELGTSYTLFISPDSKFDGGGRLDGEKIFHFRTVKYRGV